jgi:hypothetical protein
MPYSLIKTASARIRRMMMRVTSQGLKISKIQRTSSTSSSATQKPLRYSEVPISFSRED